MDVAGWPVVEQGEVRGFVERCFESLGVMHEQAADMSELLLSADYRGHYSHGLNRIGISTDFDCQVGYAML